MLTVALILFVLWFFGFLGRIGGGLVHLLLIVALGLWIIDLVNRRSL